MNYPKFLPANGTIGFVAPSFGCNIEPYQSAFRNALRKLEQSGYQIKLGPNVYKGDGIGISTNPKDCAGELTEAYEDAVSDCLISCGGGELMCEVLDHLDLERIKHAEPKWYMGYSDNTNFVFLQATVNDTAAVYGPCAPAFGMEPWHESLEDALAVLSGRKRILHGYTLYEKESLKDEEHPLLPYNVTEAVVRKVFPNRDTKIEGRLIGGCMDCLVTLLGTGYDKVKEFAQNYKEDGILWFLEACDLNPMSMRRAMWQMKAAGWFEYVKGFLIGRPYHHGETEFGLDQYHAILDIVEDLQVPVLMDLDIGHIPPMMPLVVGSYTRVTTKGNEIELEMEFI